MKTTLMSQQATLDEVVKKLDMQQKINQDLREQNMLMANLIINQDHGKRTAPPIVQGM